MMKKICTPFSNNGYIDNIDQWVRTSATKDAPSNMIELIVTCVKNFPLLLLFIDPIEAGFAQNADPIVVVFIVTPVARVPALAVMAISPERISIGHVKDSAKRDWGVDNAQWKRIARTVMYHLKQQKVVPRM